MIARWWQLNSWGRWVFAGVAEMLYFSNTTPACPKQIAEGFRPGAILAADRVTARDNNDGVVCKGGFEVDRYESGNPMVTGK